MEENIDVIADILSSKDASPLPLNTFAPRPYQLPILKALDSGYKRALVLMPRRAGKDITALNYVIRRMYTHPGVYYYIFPTYSQAKKVIWDSITNDGTRVLDFFPKELVLSMNSQEMKIRLRTQEGTESLFQLIGSDNYNALMGTNPRGCVFSEYALQDPMAYQYLRPILTANQGWALFISTPRGRNHLFHLAELAAKSPDWFYYKVTIADTKHIPMEEIERERREGLMSEDLIQQEYYCFPAGQLVFTSRGLVPIEDIPTREMVISHSGRLRAVTGTLKRPYKGPLISIKSYGSYEPILCTPEHPLRIYDKETQTYEWRQAQDLTTSDWLVFPKLPLATFSVLSPNLILLMAWYICEGSASKNALQFTVRKGEKSERVRFLLTLLDIPYSIFSAGECHQIIVNNCSLIGFLKENCGSICHNKRIPFSLIGGYEEDFFYELMKGDGCQTKEPHRPYIFSTTSKTLAYQVQQLAISLPQSFTAGVGYRPASTCVFSHGEYMSRESFQIAIYHFKRKKTPSKTHKSKYGMVARIREIETSPYEGSIYNLSVQYDQSFLVAGRAVHNCNFHLGVEGSYYGKYIDKMRLEGRIGPVPYQTGFKVHTAWDIGMRDATTIIFFQNIGGAVHVIDYYENSKEGLEHYVRHVQAKSYQYGTHIAPHDIRVREWGSGLSRIEKAKELGISFTLAPDVALMDGIEAVRTTFSKLLIDEGKCEKLIGALENYRQEYDARHRVYHSRPLHNAASHAADAMRYLSISLPKTTDKLAPTDWDRVYREAVGGPQTLPFPFSEPGPYF